MTYVQYTKKFTSIYAVVWQLIDLIIVQHKFFERCKFVKGKIFEA